MLYYIDTSSILDLDAYGLINRLRKVDIVLVPEVFQEIKKRSLKRKLVKMLPDPGPQKRAAFVPGLDSLDYGEHTVIRAMVRDRPLSRHRVYVSNDSASLNFVGARLDTICEEKMNTSEFLIKLYKENIASVKDIRNVLSSKHPPNRKCRVQLEEIIAKDNVSNS